MFPWKRKGGPEGLARDITLAILAKLLLLLLLFGVFQLAWHRVARRAEPAATEVAGAIAGKGTP